MRPCAKTVSSYSATLETLSKEPSRRNLHAPHPTPPRDPLPHSSHLPHNPLPPRDHSPPDCGILLPRSHPRNHSTPNTLGRTAIPWVFSLLLNPTINTPRRCGSSGHPTRAFAALNRPPPCHSKALPLRPPPRVPCAHPSAPLTPSPSHQCALTSHFTLRAPQRDLNAFSSTPMRSYCALHPARFLAHSSSTPVCCHYALQPVLFLARSPRRVLALPHLTHPSCL